METDKSFQNVNP